MPESIGKFFKEARREKGLSIGEACKRTKISHNVISAIEEDNLEILGPVYMKSFLRIYAQFLGLDVANILSLYSQYTGAPVREEVKTKIIPQSLPKEEVDLFKGVLRLAKKSRALIYIVVGVIILVVVFSSCRAFITKFKSRKKEVVTLQPAKVKKSEVKKAVESQFGDLGQVEYLELSVKAKLDCWMKVKVDDKLIFSGTLKKGAVESWQAQDRIEVKVGNPAAVDLELNNRLLEQFGKRTSKARSATITRQGVKVGQ